MYTQEQQIAYRTAWNEEIERWYVKHPFPKDPEVTLRRKVASAKLRNQHSKLEKQLEKDLDIITERELKIERIERWNHDWKALDSIFVEEYGPLYTEEELEWKKLYVEFVHNLDRRIIEKHGLNQISTNTTSSLVEREDR